MARTTYATTIRALRHLLDNPFARTSSAFDEATELGARASSVALDAATHALGIEAVALARAHAFACVGRGFSECAEAARAVLRDPRSAPLAPTLARVALASSRCVVALRALAGRSAALAELRRATWSTCFGRNLAQTRHVAHVIRSHDVLVVGETGTGKELVASAILAAALGGPDGAAAPSAALNVAAVPETLVESELFGHRRGAFTGATTDRRGVIRSADGGCLFLDEVGELPMTLQVKLLRVIETDLVQTVGSDVTHAVDVRFVSATHRDLRAAIGAGVFREDLYQRLAGSVLEVPSLRARPEDVVDIGERFLDEIPLGGPIGGEVERIRVWLRSDDARTHAYRGNVRELKNALRNLLLGLPSGLAQPERTAAGDDELGAGRVPIPARILRGEATLDEVSTWYVRRALVATDDNLASAARVLGIDRTTLARKRRKLTQGAMGDP